MERFVVLPDDQGFRVVDRETGAPAVIAMTLQIGMPQADADHMASLLNERAGIADRLVVRNLGASDEALVYLLELRLRVRGNQSATRLVDRAIRVAALAADPNAGAADLVRIEREMEALREDLAALLGPPKALVRH